MRILWNLWSFKESMSMRVSGKEIKENVVPQEVLSADVLLEGNSLLLEGFSVDVTNVTLVLLIPLEVIGNVSQTREGV